MYSHQKGNLINYISPKLEIRKTKNMGRGVFALRDISKNELIIVEKPIVVIEKKEIVTN